MKRIIYFMSALCLMAFSGCNETEDATPQEEPIRGLWGVKFPETVSFLPNGEPWYGPEYVSTEKIFELSYLKKYIHLTAVIPIIRNGDTGKLRTYYPGEGEYKEVPTCELFGHQDVVLYFESDTVLSLYSGIYSDEIKATRMRVAIDFTDGSVRSEGKFIARLVMPKEDERFAYFLFPYGENGYAGGSYSRFGNPPDPWYHDIRMFYERYHIEGY